MRLLSEFVITDNFNEMFLLKSSFILYKMSVGIWESCSVLIIILNRHLHSTLYFLNKLIYAKIVWSMSEIKVAAKKWVSQFWMLGYH